MELPTQDVLKKLGYTAQEIEANPFKKYMYYLSLCTYSASETNQRVKNLSPQAHKWGLVFLRYQRKLAGQFIRRSFKNGRSLKTMTKSDIEKQASGFLKVRFSRRSHTY